MDEQKTSFLNCVISLHNGKVLWKTKELVHFQVYKVLAARNFIFPIDEPGRMNCLKCSKGVWVYIYECG
ncbi:hypothetical protein Y1Q_0004258 [Alligator mississippiensis]|uniref:Uncharacterized protein n=1 Tax=Alligator mississippiensis TaxID=8496 RepID=A0A151MI50_ALLMI|nr:hypothetical protein Y1Q_0004258 [Alligator mississippiensis]